MSWRPDQRSFGSCRRTALRCRLNLPMSLAMGLIFFGATGLSQPKEAESVWPRAIIVVFERRVPELTVGTGNEGMRLRNLREKVRDQLQALPLRPGDQIFVFSEGMSRDEFSCLVYGIECGGSTAAAGRLQWSDPARASEEFLGAMLRLPSRPSASSVARHRGLHGTEFVQLAYNGDLSSLDCAIRHEVTAPMTLGYDRTVPCPLEGNQIDRNQARAVSRVELSFPVQVRAALSAIPPSKPVGQVLWVWALLKEKNYSRADTLNGIRLDFANSSPLVAFFEKADEYYQTALLRTPERLIDGGMVSIYELFSRGSQTLRNRLAAEPDLLSLTLGSGKQVPLTRDLTMTRSLSGGAWRPEVDHFALSARLTANAPGRLLLGQLRFHGDVEAAAATATPDGQGRIHFTPAATDARYQQALRAWPGQQATLFPAHIDFVIAGPDGEEPWRFAAIPTIYTLNRALQVEPFELNTRDVVWIAVFACLVGLTFILVIRPYDSELGVTGNLFWQMPVVAGAREGPLTIQGFTLAPHRRWFGGRAELEFLWEFFPPKRLPAKAGAQPITVVVDGTGVPERHWHRLSLPWRPGTRSKPGRLCDLNVRLDPGAFDRSAIEGPDLYGARFELSVKLAPRLPLPLRSAERTFSLHADIDIQEEPPQPEMTVEVLGIYQALGLADEAGGRFALVRVRNTAHQGGVPRPVEAELSLHVTQSPDCGVVLEGGGDTRRFRLEGGGQYRISLVLVPQGVPAGPQPRVISGVVEVSFQSSDASDSPKAVRSHWMVTWLPVAARVAGLDVGTSGARLFLENASTDVRAKFPLEVINRGKPDIQNEFPSMVLIDPDKGVVRVGVGSEGVFAEAGRRVESPKANLLASLGSEDEWGARRDFEAYVAALGRVWTRIRLDEGIQFARFVITLPWSYPAEVALWYRDLIFRHFEGAALVAIVHEAEAAAYFHMLRNLHIFDPNSRARFTQGREHRTLVVDAGAGTVDYAVIGAKLSPNGGFEEFFMRARAFSHAAGNRYDEEILRQVFQYFDSRQALAEDGYLRQKVLECKTELRLVMEGLKPAEGIDIEGERRYPVITERGQFMDRMEPYFEEAIVSPLAKIAASLTEVDRRESHAAEEQQRPVLDEILLTGRGALAYDFESRIAQEVANVFTPPRGELSVPLTMFEKNDMEVAVARGALVFARNLVRIVGSQHTATRDISLVALLHGEKIYSRAILRAGMQRENASGEWSFFVGDEIERAWVLAGEPTLLESGIAKAIGRLNTRASPDNGIAVLADWRPRSGVESLRVRVSADEVVEFVQPSE